MTHLGSDESATVLAVGLVQNPTAVAMTPAEDVIIVRQNGGTNRVVVLSREGRSLLRVPLTTADVATGYWGLAVSRSNVVAVPDFSKNKVVVCSLSGEWKRTIDTAALDSPLGQVCGAAFDPRGHLWVCDRTAKTFVVMETQ